MIVVFIYELNCIYFLFWYELRAWNMTYKEFRKLYMINKNNHMEYITHIIWNMDKVASNGILNIITAHNFLLPSLSG